MENTTRPDAHPTTPFTALPVEGKSAPQSRGRWLWLWWLLVPPLLWWVLRDIQVAEIGRTLARLSAGQLMILVALNVLIIALIGLRWWLILRAQGYAITLPRVAAYRLIAFGISYFTPGPQFGGEPAQVLYLQRRHNVSVAAALASVSLDKILELLANFAFLLLGIFAALQAGLLLELAPVQIFLVMLGPLALLLAYTIAVWRGREPLAAMLAAWGRRSELLDKLQQAIQAAEEQIGAFCQRQPRTVILASLVSALTWGVMLVEYWAMLRFLGVELNLVETIAALTASLIAFLFPLPGGLGVLEASLVLTMQSLGYSAEAGISASLLLRGRDILLGLAGLLAAAVISRHPHEPSLETLKKERT